MDQNYLETSEIWSYRRKEKIIWTDRVRKEEVLHRIKEKSNITHTVNGRKADWIGDILVGTAF